MFKYEFDPFEGVIVNPTSVPDDPDRFDAGLGRLISHAVDYNKRLIWLTLPIHQSHLIALATDRGFVFHNCLESHITLILRLVEGAYAPFVPTYSIGAGAVAINNKNQILVIREAIAKSMGYKLPGGHVELGEHISEAVVREVEEETGILATFDSIIGLGSKHPYQFGKSNMYFVCKVTPITDEIFISDYDEIADAKWVDVDEYLADETHNPFNRQIVRAAIKNEGLTSQKPEIGKEIGVERELFLI